MSQFRYLILSHVLLTCFCVVAISVSEHDISGHQRERSLLRVAAVTHEGAISSKSLKQAPLARSENMLSRSTQVSGATGNQTNHSLFKLETKVGTNNLQIPKRVLLTGPFSNFSTMAIRRGSTNLATWLGLSPDLRVHYFNDSSCSAYIEEYYDDELLRFFKKEAHGSFRGDLCRTAILLREGGFYIDLDMQLRVPLTELVDDDTTFMTARSANNGCLNALIATVPNSPVLRATMVQMRKWYRNESTQAWPFGPVTMERGLQQVMDNACPDRNWKDEATQFECGNDKIRLYSEVYLKNCYRWGRLICPRKRVYTWFSGVKYGLFSIPESRLSGNVEENFIGWSRAEDCRHLGCRMSGGRPSL